VVLLLLAPAASAASTDERPRIEPSRTGTPPVVDGALDDEAWEGPPLELSEWLSYNPLNGERLPQRTQVRALYDDRYLYFAFHCLDPEPEKVRSTLSRRDDLWSDDWVGLSLDSVGNGQSSYDLFVNPAGVQGDILTTPSAGENSAPDFVWDSAGRRTPEGYDVEVRLPLTTIRFRSGHEVRMGILFWRRVSRLGTSVSWPAVPAGRSFIDEHGTMVLLDLKQPLNLQVIPSLTYSRRETRAGPDGFGPAESDPDAGVSARYGVTSAATVEGTLNPDFSQVESDSFQVEVNQRYPLFFSEKRPFFMEGMGAFELAGVGGDAVMRTAVHTRTIVDPFWGGKTTGSVGRFAFGLLAAGDDAPGRQLEGEPVNPFLGDRKEFLVGRGQWSLGRSNYLGGIFTDTEFGRGHNRVAGGDLSVKAGSHHASGTFLRTETRSPDGLEEKDGVGGQVTYGYETKPFSFATQLEHYDRGFQMDTAFINQVGLTQGWTFIAPSIYPDPKKLPWFKRLVPFTWVRYGRDRIQGGSPWLAVPGVRMHFTRQGFFRLDFPFGKEVWAGQAFRVSTTRVFAQAQITRWLNLFARTEFGRSVYYDPTAPFLGRSREYVAEMSFQPSARFNQSVSYDRVEFDRLSDAERVYTVDVLNTRTTFQIDRRFSARVIVQWDSSRQSILTDLLASYELTPGTVAYAGYGSLLERGEWDGAAFVPGRGVYGTTERSFFFKASYSHRF
jgi:hypothetical protein